MLQKQTQTIAYKKRSVSSWLTMNLRFHIGLSLALIFICVANSVMAQTVGMERISNDQSRLLGSWQAIGVIRNGQYIEVKSETSYRFEKNHFVVREQGKSATAISYVTRNDQAPMQLDATLGEEKARMIYGFDSERLWISHSEPGSGRPNSLLDGNGNGISILVFRRTQPEPSRTNLLDEAFDYYHGNRGAVDLELAKAATLAAEKTGHPNARAWAAFARCYNAAGFFNQYHDVHKDTFRKLVPQLERLADSGDANSQFMLGLGAMHGFAVEQDLHTSDQYFEAAASRGHSAAAYWLGRSLEKRDSNRSLSLLRFAAAFGNAEAMARLGGIYHEGTGVRADEEKSLQWYKAGAFRKCPASMLGLGLILEDSAPEAAFNLFSDAAAANCVGGIWKLGTCFHKGKGCEQNIEKARACYLFATLKNSLAAAHDLGSLYLEEEEFDKALEAFEWASKRGWLPSTTAVGRCHENGWGCDADIDLAKTWYTKAADKGFADAKNQLARLNPKPRRPAYQSNFVWQPSPSDHASAQRAANRARQDLKRRINQANPGTQFIPRRALYGY